ncbi:DUF4381 family protein [Chromatiaceae bacterium AAb-1]|nr:DUF4381 family protein [Chromatiaceae bacterium AAb-1]
MADNHNPLAELADILEPEIATSWLPAPGWWLLMLLIAGLLTFFGCWLYRRWRFLAARRQAQQLLQQIDLQAADAASQINQLLKRLLLHYHPEQQAVISGSPAQWQHFLQQQQPDITLPPLVSLLYQPQPDADALHRFYQFAVGWLKNFNGRTLTPLTANSSSGARHA